MTIKLYNLDCADCAAKIESGVKKIPGIEKVSLHFPTGRLEYHSDNPSLVLENTIKDLIQDIEPVVEFSEPQNSRNVKTLSRLGIGAVFFVLSLLDFFPGIVHKIFALSAFALVGYPVLLQAVKNIIKLNFLDEFFLMSLACFGALALGQFSEAAGVMLFYEIGEFLQSLAVNKSRKSIEALLAVKPEEVTVLDGAVKHKMAPEAVFPGQLIEVLPGQMIALDGIIEEGNGVIDEKMLTGESLPRTVSQGGSVRGGSVNQASRIIIRVTTAYDASSLNKLIRLTRESASRKNPTERFITRFARVYTPAVIAAAVLIAVFVPLLTGGDYQVWIRRSLIFLIISCPCALMVSIPLAYFAGIGACSRKGLFVKGSDVIDNLSRVNAVAFDKTGTLTTGRIRVNRMIEFQNAVSVGQKNKIAACASSSTHPVAAAVAAFIPSAGLSVQEMHEYPGKGSSAKVQGTSVLLGNRLFLDEQGFDLDGIPDADVYAALDDHVVAGFLLADEIRTDSASVISGLRKAGIKWLAMLSGDRQNKASAVAEACNLDKSYSQLLPEQKADIYDTIRKTHGKTVFVGDGINDAPVLAMADVGIAMGLEGSAVAVEAADAVILADSLNPLLQARVISRKTAAIVVQNIILALGLKAAIMGLGLAGLSGLWEAVFADVGTTLLAVLNSLRILRNSKHGD